jgi:hypothetical protein
MREQQAAEQGHGEREVAQGVGGEVDVRRRTPGLRGRGQQQGQRDGQGEVEALAGREPLGSPA